MKTILLVTLTILALAPPAASAKVRVAASTTDLGSIAATVGGDQVEVATIARPNADIHRVEVLPSYMVRVSKARLYLKVGLGLDQWADQIIDGSHNGNLKIVDCSEGITPLEVPTGRVNASMGDVHPNGNPHYWLDPRNGAIVARTIADALSQVDPAHAADFAARAEAFGTQCEEKAKEGRLAAESLSIKDILTYHRSWSYMASAFGLRVLAEVEPVPGIPPTGKHLQDLVLLVKEHKVPLLIAEPYFSDDAGNFLARETQIKVQQVSPSCDDAAPGSYLAHFDRIIQMLNGLQRT
jgi:ABC-type Zn uptake system ZnuABC Zn-binding protein ZnuA